MEIKNRLFPYPVLCEDNDDYVDSKFESECKLTEDISDIILNFNMAVQNNDEIKWLIREGMAEYVIHIECSSTAYRVIRRPNAGEQVKYKTRIPKSRINGEISLLGAIVAAKNIGGFQSSHLNEDYTGEEIDFPKGAILAYYNMPKIYVTKNYEELAGNSTFFTIVKMKLEDGDKTVRYDINGAKIKILVDAEVYDEYVKYHLNPNLEAVNSSLLVMPAIMYMIETLRNGDVENYSSLFWYQKIKKVCTLQGKDFEEDIIGGEKTCVEIAQEFLQMPINRAFDGLSRALEEQA